MRFDASREDLLAALSKCVLATDKNSPTQVFRLCLVETNRRDSVRLFSQTEALAVDTVCPAENVELGSFVASPSRLSELVTIMPPGGIRIALTGDKISVKSLVAKRSYTIPKTIEQITPLQDPPGKGCKMPAADLMTAWTIVRPAVEIAAVEGRPLGLPELKTGDFGFRLQAFDGQLLSRYMKPGKLAPGVFVCTPKAFNVLKLMAKDDHDVTVRGDINWVYMENSDTLCAAKLPQASYRDVDALMENITPELDRFQTFVVDPSALRQSFKAVSMVESEHSKIHLICDGLTLRLESKSEGGGDVANEELSISEGAGISFEMYISLDKVMPFLNAIEDDVIHCSHIESNGALQLKSDSYRILIVGMTR